MRSGEVKIICSSNFAEEGKVSRKGVSFLPRYTEREWVTEKEGKGGIKNLIVANKSQHRRRDKWGARTKGKEKPVFKKLM